MTIHVPVWLCVSWLIGIGITIVLNWKLIGLKRQLLDLHRKDR